MNNVARHLAILVLWVLVARGAERDVVRTFPVEPGCSLAIDTYRGAITITESDAPEVRVSVHLEIGADTVAETERLLQGFELNFSQAHNEISVVARHPAETRVRFVWEDKHQIDPTFRVTVPRHCNLKLRTITGSIVVGNIAGQLSAKVENGGVFFRHVGGRADATAESGDVVVSQCDGSITARVMHGTIRVGLINGDCDLKDTSGDIEVQQANGNIHAYAEAGMAKFGVPRDYSGAADITTSGGNVILLIDPAANCNLDARTSFFGHVDCRIPATVEEGRNGGRRLVAKLNQGGPRLVLRASGGNVDLVPGVTPFE